MTFAAYFYAAGLSQLLHPLRRAPGLRRLSAALAEVHLTLMGVWLNGH